MLMFVSLDLDRVISDGHILPDCYIQMITCSAQNKYDALDQFRKRSGFNLHGKYVKVIEFDTGIKHYFE